MGNSSNGEAKLLPLDEEHVTQNIEQTFRFDFEGLPICNYSCKTKKTLENHTKNKHGGAEPRGNMARYCICI